jgi:Tol biopolymer transport system component
VVVCKVCGTENEAGAAFCGSCGSFLEWNAEPAAPDSGAGADAPTATVPIAPIPPVTPVTPAAPTPAPAPPPETGAPAGQVIVCPACGTPNEATRTFCRSCATELAPASNDAPPAMPAPPRPGPPFALLGGAAAIVLLGVLGAVFLLPQLVPAGSGTAAPSGSGLIGQGQSPGETAGQVETPVPGGSSSPTASASISPSSTPPTQSPSATPPSSLTGQIVFAASKGSNANVWVWDAVDGSLHKLAAGSGNQSDPSWKWDRSAAVYLSEKGLRIINADGSLPAVPDLTHHAVDRHPAWSPNGKLVAFASLATHGQGPSSNSLDIFTRPVANNKITNRLTDDPADDWDPNWSPDGSTIAFASRRNGDARLFLMNANGSTQRLLDLGPGIYDDPSFSPDGQWLAFTRRDDAGSPKALYVVHSDGTGMRRITNVNVNENDPTWSPDSRAIAVIRTEAGSPVVIVDATTGQELARFGVKGATNRQPDWR